MSSYPSGPDDLIVNYHDACLYGRDLLVLRRTEWLNSDCLHYQFKRLQDDFCSSNNEKKRMTLLFDPSAISFFMHQCEDADELAQFASGYGQFQDVNRLFVPVSDDMKPSTHWIIPGRGTHWSLLLLVWEKGFDQKSCPQAFHFDSVPESGNLDAAYAVASKLYQLLESLDATRPTETRIHECQVPRQKNGFDCGVHVLITTEILLRDTCEETQMGGKLRQLFDSNPNLCYEYRQRIAEDACLQATKANMKLSNDN